MQGWYPGAEGGRSIAEILFGDKVPQGKLPLTFYKDTKDLPEFTDYSMDNRTYRYFKGEPLYPFGYGLSYTSFEYSDLKVEKTSDDAVQVSFNVTNTGKKEAAEVAQIYVAPLNPSIIRPHHELKGYEKVRLAPGQQQRVSVLLPRSAFSYYDVTVHDWKFDNCNYDILVGASSSDIRLKESVK